MESHEELHPNDDKSSVSTASKNQGELEVSGNGFVSRWNWRPFAGIIYRYMKLNHISLNSYLVKALKSHNLVASFRRKSQQLVLSIRKPRK